MAIPTTIPKENSASAKNKNISVEIKKQKLKRRGNMNLRKFLEPSSSSSYICIKRLFVDDVVLKNTFGLQGSYELQGGNTYYSTKDGDAKTNAPAEDYVEDLTDFGDSSWDPEWGPYDHPTGGKISALLLNDNNQRASSEEGVTRLVGVFETNSGNPVVITKATNGPSKRRIKKNVIRDQASGLINFAKNPFIEVFITSQLGL